tara:strand:+ start:920 stop:1543 length:624 start_codon:yes stop_codon:yes gene_type:complete
MAYNTLSGTVIAAQEYLPGDLIVGNVVSGNLSTSDGSSIINIPRVSNATNNAILTNVGGDANTLTCESNFTFDGTTVSVTGEVTASTGVSASYFMGDGSRLTGITASSGGGSSFDVNGIGNANGTLQVGFNYGTTTFDASRTWTTPATLTVGDVVRVKAPAGVSSTNKLIIQGYDVNTIDGQSSVVIESPFGALELCYVVSGSYRIF